jgi:hypothetical protein
LVEVVIPASVEVLGEGAFSECKSLSSIIFESGSRLSKVEKWAFRDSELAEIVFPASVEASLRTRMTFSLVLFSFAIAVDYYLFK